jgi:hypothetical protein
MTIGLPEWRGHWLPRETSRKRGIVLLREAWWVRLLAAHTKSWLKTAEVPELEGNDVSLVWRWDDYGTSLWLGTLRHLSQHGRDSGISCIFRIMAWREIQSCGFPYSRSLLRDRSRVFLARRTKSNVVQRAKRSRMLAAELIMCWWNAINLVI